MRVFIKHIIILCVLVAPMVSKGQHQPLYGHYLVDPIIVNPAFTGYDQAPVASLSYRNQWLGLEGSPTSQMFSWHLTMRDDKNALGLTVVRDVIGISSAVSIRANYSHKYKLNPKWTMSLGANAGGSFIRNDWNTVQTYDFISLAIPSFLSHTSIGNKEKITHSFKNYNYWFGGGYVLHPNKLLDIGISGLLKCLVGVPIQGDLTVYAKYNEQIKGGLSWRSGDAISALLAYNVNPQLSIGYQYDYTLSKINTVSNGSHELNIRYLFRYVTNTVKPRFF